MGYPKDEAPKPGIERIIADLNMHRMGNEDHQAMGAITAICNQMGAIIWKVCPKNGDRSIALQKLQELKYWAQHSISHHISERVLLKEGSVTCRPLEDSSDGSSDS